MIVHRKFFIAILLGCLILSLGVMLHAENPALRFHIRKCRNWSIGIMEGRSPLVLSPVPGTKNPVLTANDVTDVTADYLADPFMIRTKSDWYMFFEVMNDRTARGEIGVANSKDGLNWNYRQIVLTEPFHLSYPYVFKYREHYYMIPESRAGKAVRIYRATNFPTRWEYVKPLIKGNFTDPSIFQYANKWWMFVCQFNHTARLFYSEHLMGPWVEHPCSPIIRNDTAKARCAGRILFLDNRIIRFAQNGKPAYGSQVRAFQIVKLTTKSYEERELQESPVLTGNGHGWNKNGMHQLDAHQVDAYKWITSVDGW